MKIGNVELSNNVFLAPMAGVTDLPFRLICRQMGAGLVFSEMVSAKGLFYGSENTKKLIEINEEERPAAIQLFGSDPQILADMAKSIEDLNFDIIDINMGCPAPKIVRNGEGSALMDNPKLIGEIVKAVVESQKKPVTVKIRKGFSSHNAIEVAKIAEENGASALSIHGRTRGQYYSGTADWDIIKEVKKNLTIPVIGNGDIISPETAEKMIDYTGCDGIMIGRAAEGNPWIFKRTAHYFKTGEILPLPTPEEKFEIMKKHMKMLVDFKGEFIGIREMRKHIAWYTKGLKDSSELRVKVNKTESYDELLNLISDYFNSLKK